MMVVALAFCHFYILENILLSMLIIYWYNVSHSHQSMVYFGPTALNTFLQELGEEIEQEMVLE